MNFRLHDADQMLQRFMDKMVLSLNFIVMYIDDILITSLDHAHHHKHFHQLFTHFQEHGFKIHPRMCILWAQSVNFLGHRVLTIQEFLCTSTVRSGMVNYYHRLIPKAAALFGPLNEHLRGTHN
ncbi:uncharacterized protein K02A2.6-like [Scylla paramamosain]|uniref:uncharacterized protein K02A2.6-like n=1 Tax=Scylla paramamosain TaxID=85552 RepID=UPI003082E391